MPEKLAIQETIKKRSKEIFDSYGKRIHEKTDQIFLTVLIVQWLAAIACAVFISPKTWIGAESAVHIHVYIAIFLGLLICVLPVTMILLKRGHILTRHTVAVSQVLFSALLIHLSGGRIETHFHVFCSLAFLAFYRDPKVLSTATTIVAIDHLVRGIYYPQSVFGVITSSEWRWVEHALWVIIEVAILTYSIIKQHQEMRTMSDRQAEVETLNNSMEKEVSSLAKDLKLYVSNINFAVDEMISSTKKILTNTSKATDMTSTTLQESETTSYIVKNMQKWSSEASDVIGVVSNIANQTNILALNAAIEANRAGQSGQGFTIVANEIKDLANKTTDSTRFISDKIININGELSETLETMVKTSDSIRSINNISTSIENLVKAQNSSNESIANSVESVSSKLSYLLNNIELMKDLVKSSASNANALRGVV